MKTYFRTRALRVTAIAGLLLAIAGGVAYATIPDGGKVFHACMLNNLGTIRLIDPTLPSSNFMSKCSPSLETPVSWNQSGQQGIQGIQGLPGAAGADGKNGIDGKNGLDGKDGAPGAPGKDGLNGTNGLDGKNGVDGKDGAAGAQGPPGPGVLDGLSYVHKDGRISEGQITGATAVCPAGTYAIGGGAQQSGDPKLIMVESYPTNDRHGWFVWFANTNDSGPFGGGEFRDYRITVACAPATNVTTDINGN